MSCDISKFVTDDAVFQAARKVVSYYVKEHIQIYYACAIADLEVGLNPRTEKWTTRMVCPSFMIHQM